jgi:HAD superfamily hydrolase (TIGR01490 family)
MTRIAAIFDLDDTLLLASSGDLFIQYVRRHRLYFRFFRPRNTIPLIASYLQYRLGSRDVPRAMARSALVARGLKEDDIWKLVASWFDEILVHAIAPAAYEKVAWHQAQGHIPVICSASSQFAVLPVAAKLNIEHTVYTHWLSENGRLTGLLRHPVVYGEGKVYWMRRWAEEQNVSLADSYFYSDHISDQPLLELVATPIAVNPDPPLEQLARQQDWEILNWRVT